MIQSFNGISPKVGKNVYIAETAMVIGDVRIGDDCSIWPSSVIRGDMNSITIGHHTNVQDGTVIHVAPDHPTIIGNNVTIGHLAHIHGAQIEDEVLIGSSSIVLDGAYIETHSVIAAGALIVPRTRIISLSLMTGLPAQCKRQITELEISHIRLNASEYVLLKDKYLADISLTK